MTETFSCPSCGGPNQAESGAKQMACTYCGANLTIPAELRREAKPKPSAEKKPKRIESSPSFENETQNFLRQAQPMAIRAWRTFAIWKWLRWLLPTCLMLIVLGCVALSLIPLLFRLFQ